MMTANHTNELETKMTYEDNLDRRQQLIDRIRAALDTGNVQQAKDLQDELEWLRTTKTQNLLDELAAESAS